MKLFPSAPNNSLSDSELVGRAIAGHMDSFAAIVSRYQSLVCSVAYSATGSLTRSEDVAQETFVAAWNQLGGLREPAKLRGWLCGIARNLVRNFNRSDRSEPSHGAASLEDIPDAPSHEALPSDQAVSSDEVDLLWRTLETIPELYREPLILFYRQHRSVEEVAAAMDLSGDAVRQRLSRGRQMLQTEIASLVERTLVRTAPGAAFTSAVMATLPLTALSGAGAGAGAIAKGGALAKAAMIVGASGVWLGPLIGVFNGYLGYRTSTLCAGEEEGRAIRNYLLRIIAPIGGFAVVTGGAVAWVLRAPHFHTLAFSAVVALTAIACIAWYAVESVRIRRQLFGMAAGKKIVSREPMFEFRSQATLFGLPLVHVRFGGFEAQCRPAIRAWIAAGDIAQGGLFAFGAVAVAPVALGGLSVGLISIGGMALGACALGGLAMGWGAMGGVAIGWLSTGGIAIAARSAMGAIAMAPDFAQGPSAHAAHANDAAAAAYFANTGFFQGGLAFVREFVIAISVFSCVFSAWIYARARKQAKGG
jgi:RNA polymerase sigma factor (sigma-70 family)